MRIIFNTLLVTIVISALNGCFFSTQDVQRWDIELQGTTSFALSRDARFALLYSKEHHLVLWDLTENQELASLGEQDPEANTVSRIRISDNGRFAVTATQMNFAVWDLAWTQAEGLWSISDGLIRDIDIASNGDQVLLGLSNGKAIYVNLVTGRRLEFLAHNEKVNSVALAPNGRFALSGGNDYKAYLWNTNTGQILHTFEHEQRVNRVALQRDGKYAFTSDGGNQAMIWDLASGEEISQLSSFSRQLIFSAARFSDDGQYLTTGTPSGRLMVWDALTGKQIERFDVEPLKDTRPPRAVVYDAAFDSQSRVVSATSAGIAQAWEVDY
ncbi:WD40 repeat domain-containing protein [Vibrio atypicus]|uniref:WD40 repeat domain-containing protein n=1 Tax=Vibrio atypicus TaxID=558271 RepID=UPI001359D31F|nr:PQQ-binding-like beta-propeller repeat protein [Vibrio atypicus]